MKHIGNLKPSAGAKKGNKRIGRGQGSGYGGHTATRGHKGQKSRSGAKIRRGFEGGQMPINRRVPKFGFSNTMFKKEFQIVNLSQIQKWIDDSKLTPDSITFDALYNSGLINKKTLPVKILGDGELSSALNIKADKFTKSAISKIESAGGTINTNG